MGNDQQAQQNTIQAPSYTRSSRRSKRENNVLTTIEDIIQGIVVSCLTEYANCKIIVLPASPTGDVTGRYFFRHNRNATPPEIAEQITKATEKIHEQFLSRNLVDDVLAPLQGQIAWHFTRVTEDTFYARSDETLTALLDLLSRTLAEWENNTFITSQDYTRQVILFLIATINEHLPMLQEIVSHSTPPSDKALSHSAWFTVSALRKKVEKQFSENKQLLEILQYLRDDFTRLYSIDNHPPPDISPYDVARLKERIPSHLRSLEIFSNAYNWSEDDLHQVCSSLFFFLPKQDETALSKRQRYHLEELRETLLDEFQEYIHFSPGGTLDDYEKGWIKGKERDIYNALFAYYLAMKEEQVYSKDFERLPLLVNYFFTPEILTRQNVPLAEYQKAYQDYVSLYHDLPLLHIANSSKIAILVAQHMREIEQRIQRIQAPGVYLWNAIKPIVAQPGARPLLTQESQALLETFLTTNKSMRDLAKESNGLWSVTGIRKNLNTSLQRVWQDIPPQYRRNYQNAKDAMQAVIASPIKTQETRRKVGIQPGWKEDKPRQTGKHSQKGITGMRGKVGEHPGGRGKKRQPREFSGTHTQRLSDGATRRWQRQREMKQAKAQQNQP